MDLKPAQGSEADLKHAHRGHQKSRPLSSRYYQGHLKIPNELILLLLLLLFLLSHLSGLQVH